MNVAMMIAPSASGQSMTVSRFPTSNSQCRSSNEAREGAQSYTKCKSQRDGWASTFGRWWSSSVYGAARDMDNRGDWVSLTNSASGERIRSRCKLGGKYGAVR